jgi:hypothetical protein
VGRGLGDRSTAHRRPIGRQERTLTQEMMTMTTNMTETKTYNGWTNYETWNVNLWLGNVEPSYLYWEETAAKVWDESEWLGEVFSKSEDARYKLSNRLKGEITGDSPLSESASMYGDLLGAALSDVNWSEIANALLDECEGYESE